MLNEFMRYTAVPFAVCLFVLVFARPVAAIYEGFTAETGEFPWFVNLSGCGGVLIDPEWVITARHCISNDIGLEASVRGNDLTPRTTTIVRVLRYDATRPDTLNDIALVQIDPPLTDIETVALPTHQDWLNATTSEELLIVGNGRRRSEYVTRNTTPALDDTTSERYLDWYKLAHERDRSIHHYSKGLGIRPFEAYGQLYPTGIQVGREEAWLADLDTPGGTCFGDSGGGLIHTRTHEDGSTTPVVIGITSSVDYCTSMAMRSLFEMDGDGDDEHHTLPNGVTIPFPAWYERQIDTETFGYTQQTNVIHPTWFDGFVLCNLPHFDQATERRTVVQGQFTSDTIDPTQFGKIMTWTAVELIDPDGKEVCVTNPDHDGTFTMYMPSNYKGSEMQLKIQSRLFHDPDAETFELLGTAVIIPDTLLQNPYETEAFDITAEHTHTVQPISMSIIASEPYGFAETVHTAASDDPLVTTEWVPNYKTVFMPMLSFAPNTEQ